MPGLHIITAAAPRALGQIPAELAPPDAIFVGGGIGEAGLLPALWEALRPGGRLVANVVSIAGEHAILEFVYGRTHLLDASHGLRPIIRENAFEDRRHRGPRPERPWGASAEGGR